MMELNYNVVGLVILVVVILLILISRRNRKDRKNMEDSINKSEMEPEEHPKDKI